MNVRESLQLAIIFSRLLFVPLELDLLCPLPCSDLIANPLGRFCISPLCGSSVSSSALAFRVLSPPFHRAWSSVSSPSFFFWCPCFRWVPGLGSSRDDYYSSDRGGDSYDSRGGGRYGGRGGGYRYCAFFSCRLFCGNEDVLAPSAVLSFSFSFLLLFFLKPFLITPTLRWSVVGSS